MIETDPFYKIRQNMVIREYEKRLSQQDIKECRDLSNDDKEQYVLLLVRKYTQNLDYYFNWGDE